MPAARPGTAHPVIRSTDELVALILIGGASYVAAAVAHETIGHGLATVISGGKVLLFSSVHILTDRSTRFIDVAGPANNLIAGAVFWIFLRKLPRASLATRLFLWLAMARNLLWGTGYMLYSGVLGQGDWLSLIRGFNPPTFWLLALELTGAITYGLTVLLAAREARAFAVSPPRFRRIILVTYFLGGVVACGAAALDPDGARWAILENAAPASFLAGIGLLAVPWLRSRVGGEVRANASETVHASPSWIMAGVLMIVFFWAVLGPGVRP